MTTLATFAPLTPTIDIPPTQIAPDTFVIHQVQPALGQPLFVYLNSMVILAEEPVIVDTGTPANRDKWLKDAFSLVEPEEGGPEPETVRPPRPWRKTGRDELSAICGETRARRRR